MIVSLGALRPDGWAQLAVGMAAAAAVAAALNGIVPRLYPWGGEEARPPEGGGAAEEDGRSTRIGSEAPNV